MHEDSIYKIKSRNLSYIYVRHTSGRVFNFLINLFIPLDIKDTQAGLKGFKRDTAELVFGHMTVNWFSFDIDILTCARDNKKKIQTVPVTFNYESEMSTISCLQQIFAMSYYLLRVFL